MPSAGFKMVVEKGPSIGVEMPLAPGQRLTIGRRPGVDLLLAGDDFVSPDHAEIVYDNGGPTLRNRSANGTLLNGRAVVEASLSVGDRISIGLIHLLSIRGGPAIVIGSAPRPSTSSSNTISSNTKSSHQRNVHSRPAADRAANRAIGARAMWKRVPWWLAAYLVLMICAAGFFGYLKMRGSAAAGLAQIQAHERQYAAMRKRPAAETERLLHLLDTAAVHERRGDTRSAYEAYREVLAVRQPVDARSPAYRYAALRIGALGAK